jgi:hypothetical protein
MLSLIKNLFKRLFCRHQWYYSHTRSCLYCPDCTAKRKIP